jgi:hypothetical protein
MDCLFNKIFDFMKEWSLFEGSGTDIIKLIVMILCGGVGGKCVHKYRNKKRLNKKTQLDSNESVTIKKSEIFDRIAILVKLHIKLKRSSKCVVLYGRDGIGKTSIASKYSKLYIFRCWYKKILWIACKDIVDGDLINHLAGKLICNNSELMQKIQPTDNRNEMIIPLLSKLFVKKVVDIL